jgi:sialidase-1
MRTVCFLILSVLALVFLPVLPGVCQDAPKASALFEDFHVVKMPAGPYGYRSMPGSIVELTDGRLLMTYQQYDANGQGAGAIAARHSSDKGKAWSDESCLVPKPKPAAKDIYCHPSLLRLANGQLLLSYIYGSGADPLFGHNYYRRSDDDGKTWGDQFIATPCPGYNIIHNDKFVQLSTGRIIAPVEREKVPSADGHAGYISFTVQSDDNGYSWHASENVVDMLPVEAQEPHVVELKDGRVLMLMRTYSGSVAQSFSTDQGRTWSKGEMIPALPLPPNSSALNVKRIPGTGDLLLLRCSGAPKENRSIRTPFVSVISKDDGATWENERVIMGDPADDYGYPSLMFTEGLAIISYHQRDGLHVARIGVDWFYGS